MCVFVIVIITDNYCICYVWCAQGMYSYNSIIYHRLDFFLQKIKNENLCKVVLFYPGKKRKIHNFLLVLCFTMCSYIFQTFFVNIACTYISRFQFLKLSWTELGSWWMFTVVLKCQERLSAKPRMHPSLTGCVRLRPLQIVTVLCTFRKIYIRILWKSISVLY